MNLLKHTSVIDKDKVKKSFTLYATMMFSVVVGILISIVNTRYLGKEQYGDFKFIINIFTFFVTFLTFGFFYSAGRLLAQKKNLSEKRLISGTIITIASVISFVLILILLIFSYLENYIFEHNLGTVIRYCLPFLFIFPFQLCLEQLLQGDNKIYQLSILRIGPKILYLGIAVLITVVSEFNLTKAILSHLLSFAIIIGGVIIYLRYKIRFNSESFNEIKKENKTYGFPVYLGAITGVASNYIAAISISYFIDNVNVGFYSLAITATAPLTMLPAVFGTVFFKDFVSARRIDKKTILLTFILGFLSLFGFLIFIDKIVVFLYTEDFRPVISLSYYIAIGSLMHGMGDFFNRFLSAKGKGKQLRNSNFILGSFNVIGFTLFVYLLGTNGAALTKLISGCLYMMIMIIYYLRYLKSKNI